MSEINIIHVNIGQEIDDIIQGHADGMTSKNVTDIQTAIIERKIKEEQQKKAVEERESKANAAREAKEKALDNVFEMLKNAAENDKLVNLNALKDAANGLYKSSSVISALKKYLVTVQGNKYRLVKTTYRKSTAYYIEEYDQ